MKKYEGVLKRVRELEYKRGISYANTNSMIYKFIKVLYILMFAWTTTTNLLFILGHILVYSGRDDISEVKDRIITVSACAVLIIAGLLLNKFKLYITSAVVSIVSSVFLLLLLARISTDDFGFLGLKTFYYVRHFIPCVLMLIFLIVLTIIAVRARIKTDSMYKKVTENLYNMYRISDDKSDELTDEQWEEFLKNYSPDSKIVVKEKNEDDE